MSFIFLLISFFSFQLLLAQTVSIDEKIGCLLEDKESEICMGLEEESNIPEANTSQKKRVFSGELMRQEAKKDASEFVLGFKYGNFRELKDYKNISLGLNFKDEPWGRWQIFAGLGNGLISQGSFKEKVVGLDWIGRKEIRTKFLLEYALSVSYSFENWEGLNSGLKRKYFPLQIKLGLRYELKKSLSLFGGISAKTPWSLKLEETYLKNISESEEQQKLLQRVSDFDESWPISAQVSLNYLFD